MSWPEHPSDPPHIDATLPTGPARWTVEGSGPDVVAIHGLPGSHWDFRWLAPALSNVRLIRVNLPGLGGAPPLRLPLTPETIVAHVRCILAAAEVKEPVLLAHSFGAAFAVHLAQDATIDAKGLALIAPAGIRPHNVLRHQRSVRLTAALARTPVLGAGIGAALLPLYRSNGFQRTTAATARRTFGIVGGWDWAGTASLAEALGARALPSLVALSHDDPIVELDSTRVWADKLGVRPLVFSDGGHILQKTRAMEIGSALAGWMGSSGCV